MDQVRENRCVDDLILIIDGNFLGYGRHGYGGAHGGGGVGGGLINQVEKATHMDLNGDGRIGGGYGHHPQHMQYGGAPGYAPPPPMQYGPGGYPPNYGAYGGAPPCPQPYNPYGGAHGYAPMPPQHGGAGGGGLMNQLERATGMDLNGDGRVGGSGYPQQYYPPGRHY